MLGWLSHVEIAWQHPSFASFLRSLAKFARVVIFDKRGTGMSDRAFESSTVEDRVDDLEAVLDHVGSKRAVLFGVSEGASTAALFAAMHPSRVAGLVLYGGTARMLVAPDFPHGVPAPFVDAVVGQIRARWGEPLFADMQAPSLAADPAFAKWLGLFMRMSASPGAAIAMFRLNAALDLRRVLPLVTVPTLVMHRAGDRISPIGAGRALAEGIRGARFVELPGDDHLPFAGDADGVIREVERFVASLPEAREPVAPLVAVLSVAVDGAPAASWSEACAALVRGYRGERVEGAELAFTFDGGLRAVRCAHALLELAEREKVGVRLGLDAGVCTMHTTGACACEQVTAAGALAASAAPATAAVSSLLYELAVGSGLSFEQADGGAYVLRARR